MNAVRRLEFFLPKVVLAAARMLRCCHFEFAVALHGVKMTPTTILTIRETAELLGSSYSEVLNPFRLQLNASSTAIP
jgi:hypothetical protein